MMYTFENIEDIKALKYPGEPKEKHIKKIDSVKMVSSRILIIQNSNTILNFQKTNHYKLITN